MHYNKAEFAINCTEELKQAARELLADVAAEAGFESFEDTENGIDGYVQTELFDKNLLDKGIEDFPLPEVLISYKVSDVEEENYNQTWEEIGFESINIDDKLIIFDANHIQESNSDDTDDVNLTSFSQLPGDKAPLNIGIAARQAFGTGTHETTRMIISQLLSMDLNGKRVLDCGCGTGILGIAASKLGADDVVGYDIDEWSVENSKHNCNINKVENMQIFQGDASVLSHVSGVFDVVLANINRNILLNDMAAFKEVMNVGATLILSGFYEEDIPMLLEKAWDMGLSEYSRFTDDKWSMLVLR